MGMTGFETREVHDPPRPTQSVDRLRAQLADAERLKTESRVREQGRRDALAAKKARADADLTRRVTELEAQLKAATSLPNADRSSFTVRRAARMFLRTGAGAALVNCPETKLTCLAQLHFEAERLLFSAFDCPIADRLDALEIATWTALEAHARHIADPAAGH